MRLRVYAKWRNKQRYTTTLYHCNFIPTKRVLNVDKERSLSWSSSSHETRWMKSHINFTFHLNIYKRKREMFIKIKNQKCYAFTITTFFYSLLWLPEIFSFYFQIFSPFSHIYIHTSCAKLSPIIDSHTSSEWSKPYPHSVKQVNK